MPGPGRLSISKRLRRAIPVQPGEGVVVARAAAALFLVEWASVAVSNASDAMFLKRVGIEWMPLVLLASSLLLTATTLVVGRAAARANHARLLRTTYAALVGLLLLLWALVAMDAPASATLLVLAAKQVQAVALFVLWLGIGARMTGRQGKRLVAPMTAGGTLGSIVGSFTSGPLGGAAGVPALLPFAAVVLAAGCVAALSTIAGATTRLAAPPARSTAPAETAPSGPGSRFRELWASSALFRALCAASFLAGVAGPILHYEFSYAADLATRSADGEQRLLGLYGAMRGWVNVGVLALQVGGTSRLFQRLGVPLATLLAPAAWLASFAGLVASPSLSVAMPASVGAGVLDRTVQDPSQRILAGLLPAGIRTAASGIVSGPAKRAGAALGCALLLVTMDGAGPSGVALAGAAAALGWLAVAVGLWRSYPRLLLESASVRAGGANDASFAMLLDAGTLRSMEPRLAGEDAAMAESACALFREAPPSEALEGVARALTIAPPSRRPLLVEAVAALLDRLGPDERPKAAVSRDLAGAAQPATGFDAGLRAALVHAVARLGGDDAEAFLGDVAAEGDGAAAFAARLALARRRGDDEAFDSAVEGALGGASAGGGGDDASASLRDLRCALRSGDPDGAGWRRRWERLLAFVEAGEADADLRAAAAGVLADVASWHADACAASAARVLALVDDADERVRAALLRYVGRCGLAGHSLLVAARLSSPSDVEYAAAGEALDALGAAAVDGLLLALRDGKRRARVRAAEILRETPVDRSALAGLVERDLAACRELAMLRGVFEAVQPGGLVAQRIRERLDERLRVVLDLVAAMLGDSRIGAIRRGLGRAWTPRDRAVLLEALETLLPGALAAGILPLLEEREPARAAAVAAASIGRAVPALDEAVPMAAHGDPLTAALLVASAGPEPLRRAAAALDVEAAERILSRRGRSTPQSADRPPMLNAVDTMLHLRNLDLFEGLTTRQLSELASVVRETVVADGGAIVSEGEFDDSMYFIVRGNVRIAKEGRVVAELGPRDFFGEMAVFDGEKRSATATAIGECRLLQLARGDLFDVMEDEPGIAIGICQTLVRRLRGLLDASSRA